MSPLVVYRGRGKGKTEGSREREGRQSEKNRNRRKVTYGEDEGRERERMRGIDGKTVRRADVGEIFRKEERQREGWCHMGRMKAERERERERERTNFFISRAPCLSLIGLFFLPDVSSN